MTGLEELKRRIGRWMDEAAFLVVDLLERLTTRRVVHLTERQPGRIVIESPPGEIAPEWQAGAQLPLETPPADRRMFRGCRVHLDLNPDRMLFRNLELPVRATEFIEGIVRSQLDRLIPWRPDDAVYGQGKPVATGANRITVMVAATSRQNVAPYVKMIMERGAHHVALAARSPDSPEGESIVVLEQNLAGILDFAKVRRLLVVLLLAVLLSSLGTAVVSAFVSYRLEARNEENTARIAELRTRSRSRTEMPIDAAADKLVALEVQKRESASSLLALESLSRSLPDHTYLSELRVEGKRVQLIGVTRDAASLIELIEKSAQFTQATFFAPTTRLAAQSGERFHIEAQIDPKVLPR